MLPNDINNPPASAGYFIHQCAGDTVLVTGEC